MFWWCWFQYELPSTWVFCFLSSNSSKIFSLLQTIPMGFGAHPASSSIDIRGCFLGVKRLGRDANQSPPFHAEVKNECNYSPLPLYTFMERAGTMLPFSRLLWINSRPGQFNKCTRFSVTELFIYSFHLFVLMLITFAPADVVENCSEYIDPIKGTARYRKLRYIMCLVTIAQH